MSHPTRTRPRIRPRRRAAALGAACLLLSLTACGTSGGGGAPTASGSAGTAHIVIKNFLFDPAALTVTPGTVVTVSNEDQTSHTLTADGHAFDTGNIAGGKTGTFTAPPAAGAYAYTCTIHPFMKGMLTVR